MRCGYNYYVMFFTLPCRHDVERFYTDIYYQLTCIRSIVFFQ